ncbi:MAG TPA: hypothetical protein VKF59_01065 [Candidatus Dormibacteraeota bacterium]|nr:hypothetical protein [Candidatus Dormibacteraeota bacterium]
MSNTLPWAGQRCRGATCGAKITFLRTEAGKFVPVDLEPTPQGNLQVRDGTATPLSKRRAEEARERGESLYISHFVTCPNSREFQKRQNARRDTTQ